METKDMNRRDFHRLSTAALGGLLAGTLAGCGGGAEKKKGDEPKSKEAPAGEEQAASEPDPMLAEPHVCRGLNTCKNQGAGGKNECAGQGACATVDAHVCGGQNACKGQGGCGETPGANACKGEGHCAVPLQGDMWNKARQRFEALMKREGKPVGAAPAA